jgi:hypothetical protein
VHIDYSILSVRAEANNAKPDPNLQHTPLNHTKANKPVRLSMYVSVTSGPAGELVSYEFIVRAHGRVYKDVKKTTSLDGADPVGEYLWDAKNFKFGKAGNYTIVGIVVIGGNRQQEPEQGTIHVSA